jgi:transcriptional regulator with XRE-family HTH domain
VSTTKRKLSTSKLSSSKEYREAFVSAFLKRYIPFQIHTIRNKKNMSQKKLAEAAKVTQGVISRAEDPDYGNLTFNTVLRIAAGFDLAFVGRFVRFSELLKLADGMTEKSLELPGFVEECEEELKQEALEAARREAMVADFLPPDKPRYGGVSVGTLMESTQNGTFGRDILEWLSPYYRESGNASVVAEASETTLPSPSGTTDTNKQGLQLVPRPPSMEVSTQSSPQVAQGRR